jgi:DNA invertase Pin-like site-specific DNA recombinase
VTKAFAYLRVSGKGQVDGDGFPRQRAAITAYAKANNIKIVEWFEEKGVSGTKEDFDRPAWTEMIGKLNGVKTIIVEKLDRLARELFIQEYIVRDFSKRGLTLLTAHSEATDDEDPTRTLFRQMLGAIAQYDRTMTVRKLAAARRRTKAKTGRCEGRKPYGFYVGEAEALNRMQELREAGMSFAAISEALNTEGLKPRTGDQWWPGIVHRILTRSAA